MKTEEKEEKTESTCNNPVPNRIAIRQLPGVYMILCCYNNKRYYGESGNVSARLSQHKSRLRRNIHEIPELQRDWNLYGETSFEFSVIFISKDCTKAEREALEREFIARFHNICYNKFDKSNRKKHSYNCTCWGHSHSEEARNLHTIVRVSEHYKDRGPEGLAIRLKGQLYPSISEASRQTKHSRDTIRRWLNDPNNLDCIQIDVSQPSKIEILQQDQEIQNTGLPKKIQLNGVIYRSISEAAKQLGCSRSNIQRRLRTDKDTRSIV